MSDPSYLDESKICFGDLEITLLTNSNERDVWRDDLLLMYKSIGYVQTYARIKAELQPSAANILEVGVARGGSTAFLHRFFDAERVVGIEIKPDPPIPLERYRASARDAIRMHYGVSQADCEAVTKIIEAEFPTGIALMIDDASHAYAASKATFETVFPYLRTGAVYIWKIGTGRTHRRHKSPDISTPISRPSRILPSS
jgi:hypothetical protein